MITRSKKHKHEEKLKIIRENRKKKKLQSWRKFLNIGDKVDTKDSSTKKRYISKWFEGEIVAKIDNRYKIHFHGWKPRFDEWVECNSEKIMPLYTHTTKWRQQLKIGDKLEVLKQHNDNVEKWHLAEILELEGDNPSNTNILVKTYSSKYPNVWYKLWSRYITKKNTHISKGDIDQIINNFNICRKI